MAILAQQDAQLSTTPHVLLTTISIIVLRLVVIVLLVASGRVSCASQVVSWVVFSLVGFFGASG